MPLPNKASNLIFRHPSIARRPSEKVQLAPQHVDYEEEGISVLVGFLRPFFEWPRRPTWSRGITSQLVAFVKVTLFRLLFDQKVAIIIQPVTINLNACLPEIEWTLAGFAEVQ